MRTKEEIRRRFKEVNEKRIADMPLLRKYYERFKYWLNHSNTATSIIVLIIVWPICLIPTWIFLFAWKLLDPSTFWQTLAFLGIIGGVLVIPQFFLFLIAAVLTFGVLAEAFDP